jgi:cytochrome c oxidase assembly factor 5
MRKRFRGNQPLSVAKEFNGQDGQSKYQLYGGKPALDTVKPTDGKSDSDESNPNNR